MKSLGWLKLLIFLTWPIILGCDSLPSLAIPEPMPVPDIWYGVATGAFQNEDPPAPGNPGYFQTDWDVSNSAGILKVQRRNGTFSYTEFERDIAALKYLGVTHYRFGVEWARIEPRPGEFNDSALEHYRLIAQRLREENIEPIVCLWHWTFPGWLTNLDDPASHGWLNPIASEHWKQFVTRVIQCLAPHVALYAPINEPGVQSLAGFVAGVFPPHALLKFDLEQQNAAACLQAFRDAASIIRNEYPGFAVADNTSAKIISIDNLAAWHLIPLDELGLLPAVLRDYSYRFVDQVIEDVDIVGITYYGRQLGVTTSLASQLPQQGGNLTDAGIEIYPQGLLQAIAETSGRYAKPILIMENGIDDREDDRRPNYIVGHINAVRAAIDQGYPVLGYLHWTLIDNFEWQEGYTSKFGLYTVDPQTRALIPRTSADRYRALISARGGQIQQF